MEIEKIFKLAIVGNAGVGKKTLLNNCYKQFNFQEKAKDDKFSGNTEYLAILETNIGKVFLKIIIFNEICNIPADIDCIIIMSDATDPNMAVKFKELYERITRIFGYNLKIINCFNKTDVKDIDTYIFDTALPSFDISAKNNKGANNMLIFALKIMTQSKEIYLKDFFTNNWVFHKNFDY